MHEIVREERPRERLKQKGAKALSVTELLTILIGSGTRSASALEIASLLTSREMDLDQLARVTRIEELTHVKGLGPARASVIVAALELGRRLAEKTSRQGDRIRCPGDAARMVMERLRYEVKEHVLTLLLSAKGKYWESKRSLLAVPVRQRCIPGKSSRPPFIIMRLP